MWVVFDPAPIDENGPVAYGIYGLRETAEDIANFLHPEDGSGQCVIARLVALPR